MCTYEKIKIDRRPALSWITYKNKWYFIYEENPNTIILKFPNNSHGIEPEFKYTLSEFKKHAPSDLYQAVFKDTMRFRSPDDLLNKLLKII